MLTVAAALTSVSAQQPARPAAGGGAAAAAPPANVVITEAKVALINTSAFGDEKQGITRMINAFKRVDSEFQPQRTQIQGMRTRYEQLVKEVNDTRPLGKPDEVTRKAEEAETMKNNIERQTQDAQRAFEKKMRESLAPLQDDVYKALDAFAKQRGITIIIDASQVPILYAADSLDITRAFIADYNQRNPATAAAATTPPR